MPLTIYNSLTRKKEVFKPVHDGIVNMYVCGPTVYGLSHLGHAKSYVSFDVVARYLRYLGYTVTYVQNITDVGHLTDDADEGEDKIAQQAKRDRLHPMQIVEMYTREYFADMDALNILRPDISPRAAGHIPEQIELAQDLLAKGFAYEVNGSVYFDVSRDKEYGKLSGRLVDEAESGTRIDVKSEKRHPADFALWKKAEPGHIMQWNSPWGKGFPGWHLECSAMSMKYLGETFDIHGGGLDNQFPHHECEIAQSECSTGHPFVKYWMHNNLVTVYGKKMGKSLGNFITLKDAFKKIDPIAIRFAILQSHYRSTLDFSEQGLEGAAKGLGKLRNTLQKLRDEIDLREKTEHQGQHSKIDEIEKYRKDIEDSLNDDFNTPKALASLFDLSSFINDFQQGSTLTSESINAALQIFASFGENVLGIFPQTGSAQEESVEPQLMNLIIAIRNESRKNKNFAISDKIRDELKSAGIVIEDGKEGKTFWKKV